MTTRHRWTPSLLDAAEKLVREYGEKHACAMFGMRPGSVHDALRRHNRRLKRDWTPELLEAAQQLIRQHGMKHAAAMMGLRPGSLYEALRRHGASVARENAWNSERIKRALAVAVVSGVKAAAAAEKCSQSTLTLAFSRAGVSVKRVRERARRASL